MSTSITRDPASITTELSRVISCQEELAQILSSDSISSYDKNVHLLSKC